MNTNVALIVSNGSYPYITGVIDYIRNFMRQEFGVGFNFYLADSVDEVDLQPQSIVFVVGEPFGAFERKEACYYVYLNFSVLYNLGRLRDASFGALRLQASKRKKLKNKLKSIDYILEYYAEQVPMLEKNTGLPISKLPIGIGVHDKSQLSVEGRSYDVGFVGGVSPRRQVILNELRSKGFHLSPQTGVVLEEILIQSRVCLNIHMHRSLHVEYPRILGAFSSGAALISEHCHAMDEVIPADTYVSSDYTTIVSEVISLLEDDEKRMRLASRARAWLINDHLPRCSKEWSQILGDVMGRYHRKYN